MTKVEAPKVGVLAFQGDFAKHLEVLAQLGVQATEVRDVQHLSSVEQLIIPGGESTVIAGFLRQSKLATEVKRRHQARTLSLMGTCAGAIILAAHPTPIIGAIDIGVERNAYGAQLDSFTADIKITSIGRKRVSFIRAPRIVQVGPGIETMAEYKGQPVLVRSGNVVAATFHTEVWNDPWLHQLFLSF